MTLAIVTTTRQPSVTIDAHEVLIEIGAQDGFSITGMAQWPSGAGQWIDSQTWLDGNTWTEA